MREVPSLHGRDLPALVIDKLTKRFRGKIALDEVSFDVPAASLTVILGPAGAGKTTMLRLIAGLDWPDSGTVILGGEDVGGWEPKDRNIAMILDNLALYPNKTGFENIASPLVIRGAPKSEIETKVAEVAATLQISHILKRLPKTMSGGERQRIALGRALIRTPKLFLLDEPLSSLDAMLRIELRAELKRLQRDLGYSFLLATPDYNEALAIADRVVVLREGRVVQVARPQTLYDEPIDRDVARVVGSPQINLIEARCVPHEDGGYIEVAQGRLPVPSHLNRTLASREGPFELGIRPENLRFTDPARAPISAMLIDIEPLGLKSVLTVRNPGAELRLLVESSLTWNILPGERVGVEPINDSMLLAFDPSTGQRMSPSLLN
jgi:multiple sugar transport system ATP-binding protein